MKNYINQLILTLINENRLNRFSLIIFNFLIYIYIIFFFNQMKMQNDDSNVVHFASRNTILKKKKALTFSRRVVMIGKPFSV